MAESGVRLWDGGPHAPPHPLSRPPRVDCARRRAGREARRAAPGRTRIGGWRTACTKLEGVVLVGNVRLPSFFMPRADTPSTRYWTRYYEDQDGDFEQRIKHGTVLHKPKKEGEWPCIVTADEFTVPEHDFDWVDQGPAKGCEMWVALLPVGLTDAAKDGYDGWAGQLRPFLKKALAFYKEPGTYARSLYLVSNDLNLGRAHLRQLAEQERLSTDPMGLRGRQEVLIGDPFVDANR